MAHEIIPGVFGYREGEEAPAGEDYVLTRQRDKGLLIANRSAFQDRRLSAAARGTLAFLLTLPPGWKIRVRHIEEELGASPYLRRKYFQELLDHGYMDRYRERNARGHVRGWLFEFADEPMQDTKYLHNKAKREQREAQKAVRQIVAKRDGSAPPVSTASLES